MFGRKKQLQLLEDYRQTFSSSAGQRVLEDLMRHFHMMGTTINEENLNLTFHSEGERNVVLYILNQLRMSREDVRSMIMEAEYMQEQEDDEWLTT